MVHSSSLPLWLGCLVLPMGGSAAFTQRGSAYMKPGVTAPTRHGPRWGVRMSSSSDLYLGVDCGTQGTKVAVYDAETKSVLGLGAVAYGLNPSEVAGRAEQDPQVWVDAMRDAAIMALEQAGPDARAAIKGIGVSGQQHGLVALDADYGVIRPSKLWCDTESAPEAVALSKKLGYEIVASFTSTKLLWLKTNEPESYAKMQHVALPHDYLNYCLTGELVMECGDASGTGLLDTKGRTWDASAAAMIDDGLASKLPPLIAPTDTVGNGLTSAWADTLGIPVGTPVSPGGGDNMMSALGCGCSIKGRVAISLGTSGVIFAKTDEAALDKTGAVCPFLDATGGGLPLTCTLNCASVPEEVVAAYGMSREEITALAEQEPIGCEGLTFLPYLAGERTPNWPHASGCLVGIRAGHLARPGLVYRAALEGVSFSIRNSLASMKLHGVPPDAAEARVVGGGSKSSLWREILADALQMRVTCPSSPESGAIGAALQAAAVVAGVEDIGAWIAENHDPPVDDSKTAEPNIANAGAYDAAYALYEERGKALFE